jgi:arylsulfatase A-like enzyme
VVDLRGGKASLWEGGIRVPGLLEWPAVIKKPRTTDVPFVTSDFLPTTMAALGYDITGYPLDGINMLSLIEGKMEKRPSPIFFSRTGSYVVHQDRYKLMYEKNIKKWALYDMVNDRSESTDVADQHPELVETLKRQCLAWAASLKPSKNGADYPIHYQLNPLNSMEN